MHNTGVKPQGSFFFKNAKVCNRRVPPMRTCTNKGGEGVQKGQIYANVIIELPPIKMTSSSNQRTQKSSNTEKQKIIF